MKTRNEGPRQRSRSRRPGLTSVEALERASRKLRETRFFLGHMELTEAKGETGFSADPDVFPFFLSAFQAAARSVIQTLRTGRCGPIIDKWQADLNAKDRALLAFMTEERDNEVHRSGTTEQATWDMVPLTEIRQPQYAHPAYGHHFFGLPGTSTPTVGVRRYSYDVGGFTDRVTNIAARYTALLEQLVGLADPRR
jgi:hypothetical protein